jgi:anaerobic selenocysteine-containing dehydrogenase
MSDQADALTSHQGDSDAGWQKTACILCSINCGIELQLGGPVGRTITRVRGDRAHPSSRGYTCEKPQRLDYYQNAADRLRHPLRRRADGGFEQIDWDTAISEIAARLQDIKAANGGESIFYYGGGGQGNHLGGSYADSTLRALGSKFRSNALAQEKTGEMWVNGRMFGAGIHGDFEHCEVAVFIGKNPWQSHGFARARAVLRQIAKDPNRSIVVIDPRRSETAELADYHLAIKPGSDAWCLSALVAILIQEDLIARPWLSKHTSGADVIESAFAGIAVGEYAQKCGIPENRLREAARRIARASSVAVMEDLGLQMSLHSTLGSYIEKLIWTLTGNFGKAGSSYTPSPLIALTALSRGGVVGAAPGEKSPKRSPVTGARVIGGLIPCNAIPEEILTDHPNRFRAMIVESANPAHSLADTGKMRAALDALDLLVVIDVAMTETARLAHYILPAPTQYEKYEAAYFNFEFPENFFHLRRPLLEPPAGTLPEPEIHARLVEALGAITDDELAPLRAAAQEGRPAFARAFFSSIQANPNLAQLAPVVLYRTLGPTLPKGADSAAILWAACHLFVRNYPEAVAKAGFGGNAFEAAESMFEALLNNPSGVVFSSEQQQDSWRRVRLPEGKINLVIPELLEELGKLRTTSPSFEPGFPLILSAGERRSDTANTIYRNPEWRTKEQSASLRISPLDAQSLGLADGDRARLSTRRGSTDVTVDVSDIMQPGHISLPNGTGVDYDAGDGVILRSGTAPNELTSIEDRDFLAGTPWHKHVPSRLERLPQ